MAVYYNEIDGYAAQWLRNLIKAGQIPDGVVDERDIKDVQSKDLNGFTQCHFFAGIGGWPLALHYVGWPDDRPIWTGSCPCQPFSAAGQGKAADDERHLWPVWLSLISERRPAIIFGEQVEAAVKWGWLDVVFGDLESKSYACGAAVLPACSVGAPHIRNRIYWGALADANGKRLEGIHEAEWRINLQPIAENIRGMWLSEPAMARVANGVPNKMGRVRAYGNAIVPQLAAQFVTAFIGVK